MKRLLKNLLLLGISIAMFAACGDESEKQKNEDYANENTSNGTLTKGAFSIAQGKQVYFSQGNLQYQASTGTWHFAEHQWDMIGEDNKNISRNYDGWIDLFGWGTSGYNDQYPSEYDTDYGDGKNDIAGTNYDWGVYNKISNGGNKAGMWRTLTVNEWNYLFNVRPHCNQLLSHGLVDGINGLILLPDDWEQPESVKFTSGRYYDTTIKDWVDPIGDKNLGKYFDINDYTLKEWNLMEANGAVFLPAAGYLIGTVVDEVGSDGYYWSSSAYGNNKAYYLKFYSDVDTGKNLLALVKSLLDYLYFNRNTIDVCRRDSRHLGRSVRLVRDL